MGFTPYKVRDQMSTDNTPRPTVNDWQLCPKCNGDGTVPIFNGAIFHQFAPCDLCNGTKIISMQTGLPPEQQITIQFENDLPNNPNHGDPDSKELWNK